MKTWPPWGFTVFPIWLVEIWSHNFAQSSLNMCCNAILDNVKHGVRLLQNIAFRRRAVCLIGNSKIKYLNAEDVTLFFHFHRCHSPFSKRASSFSVDEKYTLYPPVIHKNAVGMFYLLWKLQCICHVTTIIEKSIEQFQHNL